MAQVARQADARSAGVVAAMVAEAVAAAAAGVVAVAAAGVKKLLPEYERDTIG